MEFNGNGKENENECSCLYDSIFQIETLFADAGFCFKCYGFLICEPNLFKKLEYNFGAGVCMQCECVNFNEYSNTK